MGKKGQPQSIHLAGADPNRGNTARLWPQLPLVAEGSRTLGGPVLWKSSLELQLPHGWKILDVYRHPSPLPTMDSRLIFNQDRDSVKI